jgi:tyrosine-protein phosphatase OCA6
VEQGITRGAYPILRNFRFLSRMRLKTVISLTPEAPSKDLYDFAELAGISVVHISVSNYDIIVGLVGDTRHE